MQEWSVSNERQRKATSRCRIVDKMIEMEIKAMHMFVQSCLLAGSHIKIMDFITQDCCTCSLISEPHRDQTP